MIFIDLFVNFFKIGLFSIGGGLATLPLLQDAVVKYNWMTMEQFADMIAISQSTPGPIGINMATFVGYKTGGLLGAVTATSGIVTPSIIIIVIIAHYFKKFNEEPKVKAAFYGLRPAVTALIAAACYKVAAIALINIDKYKITGKVGSLFNLKTIALCALILFLSNKYKKHPIIYIIFSAVIGIIFKL